MNQESTDGERQTLFRSILQPTSINMPSLVQELPPGPLDLVGDIHGDISALMQLVRHLGYGPDGGHPDGRHLVLLGDLVDRGPDSVAVVQTVQSWLGAGRAHCVLGNHELNILLEQHGLGPQKFDNGWFYGETFVDPHTGNAVSQSTLNDQASRDAMVQFFAKLPLVLQREDVRVVHACWQSEMVSMATEATSVVEFYKQHRYNINLGLAIRSDMKDWQREQRHQNLNPVKVLTSGLEVKTDQPFEASGKLRFLDRYPWWSDYQETPFCFFGHYSQPDEPGAPARLTSRAICLDFGVARRWVPKTAGVDSSTKWRLGAVRFPELELVFDDGETRLLPPPPAARK